MNFATGDKREPLTDIADIIKVDVRSTSLEERADMVKRYGPWRCRMLAEKVETREEFMAAKKAGFAYFQGYFFRRPETENARCPRQPAQLHKDAAGSFQARTGAAGDRKRHQGRGLAVLSPAALHELCQLRLCQRDPLRAARALDAGKRGVRRWVRLVVTLAAGQNKSSDLVLSALVRARFCELLSPKIKHGEIDLFLLGLLSLMDSILELPMTDVLEKCRSIRKPRQYFWAGPATSGHSIS
jgi:EAL and modified HD-GYP domain-containing signal transduction protein